MLQPLLLFMRAISRDYRYFFSPCFFIDDYLLTTTDYAYADFFHISPSFDDAIYAERAPPCHYAILRLR